MTRTLWHRFPAKDHAAMLRSLAELVAEDDAVISLDERKAVASLRDSAARGFSQKQDLDLDLELLGRCLEFAICACETDRRSQLRQVLKRIRAHRRGVSPGEGG